ncbi:MAG: RagB/SusD family nutrient uptake outer membrane protein [Prevotella sp.]|nr:RagB/SusD family nutrient uptake outer membrane protein [Prevotella sp.]
MRKVNITISAVLMMVAIMVTSCGEDFLDRTPKHGYVAGNYYSTDDAVIKALEPLYNYAWSGYNERGIVGMGSFRANDAWSPYLQGEFARFTITGLTTEIVNAWSSIYMVVSMANQVINDMDTYTTSDVSEAVKNQARGEAMLMRGTAYFYLLRGWGEVVLYEDNVDITSRPVRPLATEESVLKFIVRDFERAAELLPERGANFHPSRYVAKALLAKALLAQSGWNKGQRDETILQRVVALCDEVINCGQYKLLDNYENLFRPQFNDNEETLLAMRWADPLLGEYASSNNLISDLAWSDVTDVNCWGGSLHASVDMINYYNEEPADSFRLRGTFFTPGRYYSYIWSEKGGYTYNTNWMQCKKGVVGTKADCDGHLAQQASPLNTYIMRLADVYLIKAEALLGNNNSTSDPRALAAFNATRLRAKLPPKNSFTFEDLIRERRIEFCMEYCNWYDMVTWYRWKPQYMLDFFNYKQHRAFMLNSGDVMMNEDHTLSYRCVFPGTNNWYFFDNEGHCYWSDCLRASETDNTVVKTAKEGYSYNLDSLANSRGADYSPIVLSEANIFMPYPEADVIQNPYFNQQPQDYDFSKE